MSHGNWSSYAEFEEYKRKQELCISQRFHPDEGTQNAMEFVNEVEQFAGHLCGGYGNGRLPNLKSISGGLHVVGRMNAPELVSVGGDILVRGGGLLIAPKLLHVGGDFVVDKGGSVDCGLAELYIRDNFSPASSWVS